MLYNNKYNMHRR